MRKLTCRTWKGIVVLCILLFILEGYVFGFVNMAAFGSLGEFDPFLAILKIVMGLTVIAGATALAFALAEKDEE